MIHKLYLYIALSTTSKISIQNLDQQLCLKSLVAHLTSADNASWIASSEVKWWNIVENPKSTAKLQKGP